MATITPQTPHPSGFSVNANGDLSGCEELVAAPGAGKSHYIEGIVISGSATQSITIGAGETAGAVAAALFGPIYQSNTGAGLPYKFKKPLTVGDNVALTVDASTADPVTVFVEGLTK